LLRSNARPIATLNSSRGKWTSTFPALSSPKSLVLKLFRYGQKSYFLQVCNINVA
ncbi:hypothetical protein BT69DRAFT_1345309, partial [Atractiella rhizophila]